MQPALLLSHPKYRRDIDGLRAVAVLCVVFHHAFPDFVTGGFIGVDVFFVISGFLISTIILENLATASFSFGAFYARRIRRIFPALGVVLIACAIAGWHLLLPVDYKLLGKHLFGGAAFIANLMLWQEAGYFDVASALKPLLHLWSLGVEEQFYLLWPFAVWLAWRARFGTRTLIWIVTALSFGFSLAIVTSNPTADFYSPATRLWELMLGCALAQSALPVTDAQARAIPAVASRWFGASQDAKSVLGLALIAAGTFALHRDDPFPGALALLPTIGAYLAIAAGPDAVLNRTLLSNRVMVFFGLISYPLYLWHWPLLSFARIVESDPPSAVVRSSLILLSVVLAWMTWQWVEKPLRFGTRSAAKIAALSTAMTAIALAGVAIWLSHGVVSRMNDDVRSYANFSYNLREGTRVGLCWLNVNQAPDAYAPSCTDPETVPNRPLLMVWGDSHAAAFFPGLRATVGERFRLAQYTRDGCHPFLRTRYEICDNSNGYILDKIAQVKPAVVILFAYWFDYANQTPQENSSKLLSTIARLKSLGVPKIIVVGPAPRWKLPLPDTLVHLQLAHARARAPERTTYGLDTTIASLDSAFRAELGQEAGVTYFSAYDTLCDVQGCLTRIGDDLNALTTWDYGHLTKYGATYVAQKLSSATNDFWTQP